jgi:pyruvate/2-oxoglutarate dehydrogenase complex dihydrolipoamide dehydrogenase (E3) component
MKRAEEFGLKADSIGFDYARVKQRKDEIVSRLVGPRFERYLQRTGVSVLRGEASFISPHQVRVGEEIVDADRFIIATGSFPVIPPIPGLQETGYITSTEALDLTELPSSFLIMGAGAIGLEFAQAFVSFDSSVTVLELADRILVGEDEEISSILARYLSEQGIEIQTKIRVLHAQKANGKKALVCETPEGRKTFEGSEILVATGRRPYFDGLNLEAAGVRADNRGVVVDNCLKSSVPHILAAGDAVGAYQFSHVAAYEGELAGANAASKMSCAADYRVVPRATFTYPEVGSVGLTENQARERGHEIAVSTFPFTSLGRALAMGEAVGLVKIIAEADAGQILGAHILGPRAGDLVHELAAAMFNQITAGELAKVIHIHPTLPEAVSYALENLVAELEKMGCCAA